MKAIVVYESFWGNTAAIARSIAEGIGNGTPALHTSEAIGAALEGVDLIVAGAPILAFSLPTEKLRESLKMKNTKEPTPADVSHPSMRAWLASLPAGHAAMATFETRIWWSPGSALKTIANELIRLGYRPVSKGMRFLVTGTYGPLKGGEIERARQWGAELRQSLK